MAVFQKGHTAWNKGKTGLQSHSEEARKKMSLAKLGKSSPWLRTEEVREKIRQGNIGRKASEETRRKQSEARKGVKPWCTGTKGVVIAWNKGKKLSKEHCENLSKTHIAKKQRGDKHWNWKGGRTEINRLLRERIEGKQWKQEVFKRDNFTCQKYGTIGGNLQAHHICNWADYPELRYELSNDITLSKKAHDEFHSKYGKRNNTYEQLIEFLGIEELKTAI